MIYIGRHAPNIFYCEGFSYCNFSFGEATAQKDLRDEQEKHHYSSCACLLNVKR